MSELSELLDEVEMFIRRYVVLDDTQATAATLWTPHTWAIGAAHATPYLFVTSAEPECGKTRMLEVLRELVRSQLFTMNISDAALYRAIHTRNPTLFFDEVDSVFNPKSRERGEKNDLRAILNAGYRRGEVAIRMGGGNRTTLEEFEVFGAKALAGIGTLPPTLASRCIRIELKRRRMDEPVQDFFPMDVAEETAALKGRLEWCMTTALDELASARPERVDGLRDRTNEVWRPLLAIAAQAGDVWLPRARHAALTLAQTTDDESSLGVLLLDNIRTVFEQEQVERISTVSLVRALGDFDESPWGDWWLDKDDEPLHSSYHKLAHLLRPYRIHPTTVRAGGVQKGYKREDFVDAWERFLPPPRGAVTTVTTVTPGSHKQTAVTEVTVVTGGHGGQDPGFFDSLVADGVDERQARVIADAMQEEDDDITFADIEAANHELTRRTGSHVHDLSDSIAEARRLRSERG
jgi:Protein of unknown function (DUF3631)